MVYCRLTANVVVECKSKQQMILINGCPGTTNQSHSQGLFESKPHEACKQLLNIAIHENSYVLYSVKIQISVKLDYFWLIISTLLQFLSHILMFHSF